MISFLKENVYLIEFQPGEDMGKVTTYISNPKEDSEKMYKRSGYKVLRVVDSNHKEITHYNAITDFTDLSFFVGKKNFNFVAVMENKYKQLKWIKMIMNSFEKTPYDKIQWLYIQEQTECAKHEIALLDKWFPQYFSKMVEISK